MQNLIKTLLILISVAAGGLATTSGYVYAQAKDEAVDKLARDFVNAVKTKDKARVELLLVKLQNNPTAQASLKKAYPYYHLYYERKLKAKELKKYDLPSSDKTPTYPTTITGGRSQGRQPTANQENFNQRKNQRRQPNEVTSTGSNQNRVSNSEAARNYSNQDRTSNQDRIRSRIRNK